MDTRDIKLILLARHVQIFSVPIIPGQPRASLSSRSEPGASLLKVFRTSRNSVKAGMKATRLRSPSPSSVPGVCWMVTGFGRSLFVVSDPTDWDKCEKVPEPIVRRRRESTSSGTRIPVKQKMTTGLMSSQIPKGLNKIFGADAVGVLHQLESNQM